MLERIKVSALAATLKVSTTTIYKHLKRMKKTLEGQVTKEGGVTYLSEEAARVIREAIEAASTRVEIQPKPPIDVPAKIDDFGKSLLLIADEAKLTRNILANITEELKTTRQENIALKEELGRVLTQLQAVQSLLLPPPIEAVKKEEFPVESQQVSSEKSNFWKELQKVSSWLEDVISPFTAIFKNS